VTRAGANGVAVISAILKSSDIGHVVKSFIAQMSGPTSSAS
jgi:thiamine monophosphate synthase